MKEKTIIVRAARRQSPRISLSTSNAQHMGDKVGKRHTSRLKRAMEHSCPLFPSTV
jgi:hypothetical protein